MTHAVDFLVPWLVSIGSVVVGIYFICAAESNQRRLALRADDIALTRSGARYPRGRVYVLVTRGIGVVSVLVGLGGSYLLLRG